MKIWKTAVLVILISMLVTGVTGSSLGSFASDEKKTVDSLETTFTISVFNTGDETVNIEVESSELNDATVLHPRQMKVEPSRVTRNPSGDSTWFLLSDSRYVETTEIPVKVSIDEERVTDSFKFDVTLRASGGSSNGGNGIIQNVAQVRSYTFDVTTTAGGSATGDTTESRSVDSGPESQEGGPISSGVSAVNEAVNSFTGGSSNYENQERDPEKEVQEQSNDQEKIDGGQNLERDAGSVQTGDTDNSGESESGPDGDNATGGFFQAAGVNSITVLMIMFLLGSFIYLVRVI